MSKGNNTLEELLNDPVIQLVMARDHVRPEEVRMLFKKAQRAAEPRLEAHVIDQSYQRSGAHA